MEREIKDKSLEEFIIEIKKDSEKRKPLAPPNNFINFMKTTSDVGNKGFCESCPQDVKNGCKSTREMDCIVCTYSLICQLTGGKPYNEFCIKYHESVNKLLKARIHSEYQMCPLTEADLCLSDKEINQIGGEETAYCFSCGQPLTVECEPVMLTSFTAGIGFQDQYVYNCIEGCQTHGVLELDDEVFEAADESFED